VLTELVRSGAVSGWDDPRMPTIAGMRRRGVPPEALREFVKRIGVARADSLVDVAVLDHAVRDALNAKAERRMAVLKPLRVIVENYPEGQFEELEAVNNPENPASGTRKVRFGRELYVERDDFMEVPAKKFFRLFPGNEVRLRYAYFVRCVGVEKDAGGNVTAIRCTYDPATRGGNAPPDGRKVKTTLHWVSAADAIRGEVRLVNPLFLNPTPDVATFTTELNPNSLEVIADAMLEPAIATAGDAPMQFERLGYFRRDPDSAPGRPVFNRTVSLRDTFTRTLAEGDKAGA
jgi:glutaminyl-tRNA synthetase